MIQEEKQLLLKDLCARLPYFVKVSIGGSIAVLSPVMIATIMLKNDVDIKPYLRPMSSMTEEEKEEIRQQFCYEWEESVTELMYYSIEIRDADYFIDWLLERHFDYRGLIEKGLAIEALEGMYKQ